MNGVKRYTFQHMERKEGVMNRVVGQFVAASDFDICKKQGYDILTDYEREHSLRLAAERQVGELREQSEWRGEMAASNCREYEKQLSINHGLQDALDTAMGLLISGVGLLEAICPDDADWFMEVREFVRLNTTSTEGKDHE